MRVTVLWCPVCQRRTRCARVAASKTLGYTGETAPRNFYFDDQPDIRWFRRVRRCQTCDTAFATAELQDLFVYELKRSREELAVCRRELDRYKEQARLAVEKLSEVTTALEELGDGPHDGAQDAG
jgi:hypothetical protein